MTFRADDENLLQRLEDEVLVEALFSQLAGVAVDLPARAGGLIAELRKTSSGERAVNAALGGEMNALVRFARDLALAECSPELLHHLALAHAKAAAALERTSPDLAAEAWVRSLASWIALAGERTYLERLEAAILGPKAPRGVAIAAENVPLELVTELARRAESTARDLAPSGRAALLALARTAEAAKFAAAGPEMTQRLRSVAERRRNAAIEMALGVIGEGLDEANVRGELTTVGRTLLLRAIPVWTWTANDEAVEHFVVDRIDKIGWELYRKRDWSSLRYLLEPFRPMFDRLAHRIEGDPSQIAYAAGCAQMFVFLAEIERSLATKRDLAERAVRICPTHRNGRLVLASVLCDQALESMRAMVVFARRDEITRVEGLLVRAESLYATSSELPEAKGMLARVKKSIIAL